MKVMGFEHWPALGLGSLPSSASTELDLHELLHLQAPSFSRETAPDGSIHRGMARVTRDRMGEVLHGAQHKPVLN